jgi:hypothetical protein
MLELVHSLQVSRGHFGDRLFRVAARLALLVPYNYTDQNLDADFFFMCAQSQLDRLAAQPKRNAWDRKCGNLACMHRVKSFPYGGAIAAPFLSFSLPTHQPFLTPLWRQMKSNTLNTETTYVR